jgi:hypothetical protein
MSQQNLWIVNGYNNPKNCCTKPFLFKKSNVVTKIVNYEQCFFSLWFSKVDGYHMGVVGVKITFFWDMSIQLTT